MNKNLLHKFFVVFKNIIRYTNIGDFMEKYREVERSIIKFRKEYGQNLLGYKEYELIKENDKIAVCISGGKDSMLLAKCMQELNDMNKLVLI